MRFNSAFKRAKATKCRYRILYGGAGSGKSHYAGQETILNMLSSGEYAYLVVRKTNKSIKNSVYKLLMDVINEAELGSYFQCNRSDMSITCVTGSRLITSGLDDVEKLKSVTGINRILVEEASEISEADFEQLDLRLRGVNRVGHQLTMMFNPISELHWIKKRFFDVGVNDCFIMKSTYKDNSFLDEAYIRKLEGLEQQDYQYYRIYTLGEWGTLGNLVFSNWRKEDLSEMAERFDNHYNGLDFGFADDPAAFVRVHLDSSRKIVYIINEIYRRGAHIDELADDIKGLVDGGELVICDSAEPRSISDLRRHGVNARGAKKGKGSIEHGIKWLQSYEIVVDHGCVNMIKELSGYKWREDKDGNVIPKPIEFNNHLIDGLRYGLESAMGGRKFGAVEGF